MLLMKNQEALKLINLPELPEVQTVVNHLRPLIKNEKIISCEIYGTKLFIQRINLFF